MAGIFRQMSSDDEHDNQVWTPDGYLDEESIERLNQNVQTQKREAERRNRDLKYLDEKLRPNQVEQYRKIAEQELAVAKAESECRLLEVKIEHDADIALIDDLRRALVKLTMEKEELITLCEAHDCYKDMHQ